MHYDYSLGIWGNIEKLFSERNTQKTEIDNTNVKVDDNQSETDELMLDHEERLILLEVGE